jgi:hypothetical protein
MRPHTSSRPFKKDKCHWLAVAFLLVIAGPLTAAETTLYLLPEPAFMRPDYSFPIEGTKETILAPELVKGNDVNDLTKDDVARLKLGLDSIRRVADASANTLLASLIPEYVRDKKGVVQFVVLASDSPATAGAAFAPNLAAKFADVLGPDILVAIPNRYRVYVYPALASHFQDTADLVLRDYETSGYPVSKEVFRVTKEGLRAVGSFNMDDQ